MRKRHNRNCSTRHADGAALQDGSDDLECVDAAPGSGTAHRSRCSVEVSAPFRSNGAGSLAVGSRGSSPLTRRVAGRVCSRKPTWTVISRRQAITGVDMKPVIGKARTTPHYVAAAIQRRLFRLGAAGTVGSTGVRTDASSMLPSAASESRRAGSSGAIPLRRPFTVRGAG